MAGSRRSTCSRDRLPKGPQAASPRLGRYTLWSLSQSPFYPGAPALNMRAVLGGNMLEIWYEPADLPVSEPAIYRLLADDTTLPEKS